MLMCCFVFTSQVQNNFSSDITNGRIGKEQRGWIHWKQREILYYFIVFFMHSNVHSMVTCISLSIKCDVVLMLCKFSSPKTGSVQKEMPVNIEDKSKGEYISQVAYK